MIGAPADSPFSKGFQRRQKRRAILSEASRLFNIHGARATTLEDISARLELNKASLYYYVKSKDDLVYQCYLASCEALQDMAQAAQAEGENGAQKLAAFVRQYFQAWQEIMQNRRDHMAILSELRALGPEHRSTVTRRYRAIQDQVAQFVSEGHADGSLKPGRAADTALAVFGLLQLTVLWLPRIDPGAFSQAADDFIDIVFHGISADRTRGEKLSEAARRDHPLVEESERERLAGFCRAGSEMFNGKGYKGASLDEIVERLQVTKGSFYHHFEDKEALLYQCFKRSLELTEAVQQQIFAVKASGLDSLQQVAGQMFRIQNTDHGPLIRFNLIPSLSEKYREEILGHIRRVSDEFGRMIQRGIADGSIREVNPFIAEQMLIAAIDISAELQWLRPPGDLGKDCSDYFGFYFSGIRTAA